MSSSLVEKVALVTGGSRGIGRAIAERLARDGALVAINYAGNAEAAEETVTLIEAAGGRAFAIRAEIGSIAETEKLFRELDGELTRRGEGAGLDILVNNAGVGSSGAIGQTSEEQFDRVFRVNVKGPFLVTQAALPRLRNGGRIVNLSSGASKRPAPAFGAYAMSKAAIDTMTLVLAAELGPRGITVNAVAPGWTATEINAEARRDADLVRRVSEMTAMGRLGEVDDIAAVVAFLVSENGRWVTGQYLEASGGYLLPAAA